MNIYQIFWDLPTRRQGFALPMCIIAVAGLMLLLVGMLTVMSLERKTARSYSDLARAEFAMEAGKELAVSQITGFLKRTDVGGAAFTTWSYHAGAEENPPTPVSRGSLLALTAGRPEFDIGTTGGNPFLEAANTEWLGTSDGDPDVLLADFQAKSVDVFDFNENFALGEMNGVCLARWRDLGTDSAGRRTRFAVWVDDETSRLDVTKIGTKDREDGISPAEIPFFEAGKLVAAEKEAQGFWRTAASARTSLDETRYPKELSFASTAFSRGYDVLAFAPSHAEAGAAEKNGFQLPLRRRPETEPKLDWPPHRWRRGRARGALDRVDGQWGGRLFQKTEPQLLARCYWRKYARA